MEDRDMETDDKRNRIVEAARKWIGTPYVHQASKRGAGCDCLGLLRGVWRDLFGGEPEDAPPYSPDWSETTGAEEMYTAFKRHFGEVAPADVAPGDVALFRMMPWGPAKHCGIIGCATAPLLERSVARRFERLTLIHSRANTRVQEEPLTDTWRRRMAYAFRL
jgi:NlpC/P60 family putative phage cell wall peptidase